jgi:hypothetical protein
MHFLFDDDILVGGVLYQLLVLPAGILARLSGHMMWT